MKQFKSILLDLHGENKGMLRKIYVDKHVYIESCSSSEQPIEDERIFSYRDLAFRFVGTGMRQPERMNLYILIPQSVLGIGDITHSVPCEDFLLRILSPQVARLSQSLENDRKDSREKAKFESQTVNQRILRRNGLVYDEARQAFMLRILFRMPLINGTTVNAKSGLRAVRSLLETVELALRDFDREALKRHLQTWQYQTEILKWLSENDKIAFIANESILPRQDGSDLPMRNAVPFAAPSDLEATITFSDGSEISGMALSRGVTVITGGGYSGKSTLLDALETGIYHHVPGDGREYVLSCPDSMKIYAEDGRPVHEMDLSLFFRELSPELSFRRFSTACASGSVSQAANILEAIYAGCGLLLIDEDSSATNFMIRDALIRRLVQKEPIIPFTDRVRAIYERLGISTVLVIGGSGEYLQHADLCLLMEDYRVQNVTGPAGELIETARGQEPGFEEPLSLINHRYLKRPESALPFYISQSVSVDKAHYIQIDSYTSDVSRLTALVSEEQFQTVAYLLECWMNGCAEDDSECIRVASELTEVFASQPEITEKIQADNYQFKLWLEEIRPMDLLAALFRMRGVTIFG